jgi:hypothetical protein
MFLIPLSTACVTISLPQPGFGCEHSSYTHSLELKSLPAAQCRLALDHLDWRTNNRGKNTGVAATATFARTDDLKRVSALYSCLVGIEIDLVPPTRTPALYPMVLLPFATIKPRRRNTYPYKELIAYMGMLEPSKGGVFRKDPELKSCCVLTGHQLS